ncbi:hypothetical protein As57867_007531, partial [Aphanomyces stellatus]
MVEVTLNCLVVGEGNPFPVVIDAEKTVGILKKKIKMEKEYQFPADELQLYRVDGLAQDEDEQFVYKGTTIDMTTCSLDFFGEDKAKMPPLSLISERFNEADVNTRWKIHVLVVVKSLEVELAEPTLKRWVELNEVLDAHKKMKLVDGVSSTAYSALSWLAIQPVFGKYTVQSIFPRREIESEDMNALYACMKLFTKALG